MSDEHDRVTEELTDRIMTLIEDPTAPDPFGPQNAAEVLVFAEEGARVEAEIRDYNARIAEMDEGGAVLALLGAVRKDDPACVAPVAAMAVIAERFGLSSFGLRLNVLDFAALRGLLTADEQEEQARRWGGSELRFLTRCGFTRVTVGDGA